MIDQQLVLALVPIVIGITQAAKRLRLPDAAAPALSLLLGIGAALVWGDGGWRDLSLTGVVIGLSASGLYSGITATRTNAAVRVRRRA